jgi:hypothetical protein
MNSANLKLKISPHRHRYHILVAMLHHLDVLNHSHDRISGSHTLPHDLSFPLLLPAVDQTGETISVNGDVSAAYGEEMVQTGAFNVCTWRNV